LRFLCFLVLLLGVTARIRETRQKKITKEFLTPEEEQEIADIGKEIHFDISKATIKKASGDVEKLEMVDLTLPKASFLEVNMIKTQSTVTFPPFLAYDTSRGSGQKGNYCYVAYDRKAHTVDYAQMLERATALIGMIDGNTGVWDGTPYIVAARAFVAHPPGDSADNQYRLIGHLLRLIAVAEIVGEQEYIQHLHSNWASVHCSNAIRDHIFNHGMFNDMLGWYDGGNEIWPNQWTSLTPEPDRSAHNNLNYNGEAHGTAKILLNLLIERAGTVTAAVAREVLPDAAEMYALCCFDSVAFYVYSRGQAYVDSDDIGGDVTAIAARFVNFVARARAWGAAAAPQ